MEVIWNDVLDKLEVPKEISTKWWDKIVAQYSENTRIYHNMDNCLSKKFEIYNDMIKDNISEHSAFVLAIFFQHYQYDTKVYGECIDKNVECVKEFFKDAGIKHEGLISSVVGLLGAGREGTSCSGDTATANAYFQDLELAPLGLPHDHYTQYTNDVMKEYSHMPTHLYMSLRLKVLQTLLLIPKIYSTNVFHDKYEDIARQNIQKEINELLVS